MRLGVAARATERGGAPTLITMTFSLSILSSAIFAPSRLRAFAPSRLRAFAPSRLRAVARNLLLIEESRILAEAQRSAGKTRNRYLELSTTPSKREDAL